MLWLRLREGWWTWLRPRRQSENSQTENNAEKLTARELQSRHSLHEVRTELQRANDINEQLKTENTQLRLENEKMIDLLQKFAENNNRTVVNDDQFTNTINLA
jgi:hypothetical protein